MRDQLLFCLELRIEHLAEFVVVRLDEPRPVLQDLEEQPLRRVDDDADGASSESFHDALIDVVGQSVRYAARQDERIARMELFKLLEKLLLRRLCNLRPLPVDFRLFLRLDLHVDARKSFGEMHEVRRAAKALELLLHGLPRKSRHESQRTARVAEVLQDHRHVQSLAAGQDMLVRHAVDLAFFERVEPQDVVERRVECHGVNHILHLNPI